MNELPSIPMPDWVKPRPGWKYAGWIARNPEGPMTFEEYVEYVQRSDHGEAREVDIYPEGAACWYKEKE